MTRGAAVAALVLAGCFSKPGLSREDAGMDAGSDAAGTCTQAQASQPGVRVSTAPSPVVTVMPDFDVGFASDLGSYPMPEQISLGGDQLLAAPFASCSEEDRVGVAVYPNFLIAADSTTNTRSLERAVVGPAYTELVTHWAYELPTTCGGTDNRSRGTTSWGFFPDGRIVRHDTVVPSDENDGITATCPCGGAGNSSFIITSFFVLARAVLAEVVQPSVGEGNASPPVIAAPVVLQHDPSVCVRSVGGARLAMSWRESPVDPIVPTRIRGLTNSVAIVYDMSNSELSTVGEDTEFAVTTILRASTALAPVDCATLTTQVTNHFATPLLQAGAGTYTANERGFYELPLPFSEPFTIRPSGGSIQGAFTISVQLPDFTGVATSAENIVWQRDGDLFTITFLQNLISGDTITVTPVCAVEA